MTNVLIIDSLLDGVKQNKLYPNTFKIPSENDLNYLRVGDYVKVCDISKNERFWCEIKELMKTGYVCRVDNDLVSKANYDLNDLIFVERKNILATMLDRAGEC